jgi:phage terminase large subunit-like protein
MSDGRPLELRSWQSELVAAVWDCQPRPRLAAWALARGNGKSSLSAALAVWTLFTAGEDVSIDVIAVDERQAGIVFGIAAKFISRHPELAERVQVYRDRLVYPATGSEMCCLPGTPAALEGRNPDLCICDEGGRLLPEAYEVVSLASGKKPVSTILLIGTPGPRADNVLARVRETALATPEDTTQVYREVSAAGFESHPTDCEHCWELANPALDDFLYRDALAALQPPKMAESHFRRTRLVQWVTDNDDPFVIPEVWDGLAAPGPVRDGTDVVIALDGSHSRDCTALLVGSVAATPHFDVVKVWANPGDQDWRVDVLAVEDQIRQACQRWNVREVVADPFRWNRTLQVLAAEGIPVVEFPHSPARLTKATTDLHSAIGNSGLTHSGDATLRAHMLAASVIESGGGLRLGKVSRSRHAPKIDLAACLLMGFSRCSWLASRKPKRSRVIGV